MKRIAKVLLTLGVLLVVPAGLSADRSDPVLCFRVTPQGPMFVLIPPQAVGRLLAHGWVCPSPCGPPGSGTGC